MCDLVLPFVIDRRPRAYRPDIVELPVDTAHAVGFTAAEAYDCQLEGVCLHHLGVVGVTLQDGGCAGVMGGIHGEILVSVDVALVESEDQAADGTVAWGCELDDGAVFWHRLHSIFRIESSNISFVLFNRSATTPNPPEMDIS